MKLRLILLVIPMLLIAFAWGVLTQRLNIFPYHQISFLYSLFLPSSPVRESFLSPQWKARKESFDNFHPQADVVMIGDSLTDWAEWQDMFPAVKIANRAISGDTTEGVLERMPGIYAVNAQKAFIMLGNNDFTVINEEPDVVFGKYSRIIDLLRAHGVRVYVVSTLFCNIKKLESCGAVNVKVNLLNARLAKIPGVVFIDLNNQLSDSRGLKDKFTEDGIHLTAEAYQVWKDTIQPFVIGRR